MFTAFQQGTPMIEQTFSPITLKIIFQFYDENEVPLPHCGVATPRNIRLLLGSPASVYFFIFSFPPPLNKFLGFFLAVHFCGSPCRLLDDIQEYFFLLSNVRNKQSSPGGQVPTCSLVTKHIQILRPQNPTAEKKLSSQLRTTRELIMIFV